jgi:hypothetical protein
LGAGRSSAIEQQPDFGDFSAAQPPGAHPHSAKALDGAIPTTSMASVLRAEVRRIWKVPIMSSLVVAF